MSETPNTFNEWAVVEIMGHVRYAGQVSEQTIGGCAFVRIDVPKIAEQPAFTKLFGAGAIYSITPCSEEVAREAAFRFAARPLHVVDFTNRDRQHALAFDRDHDHDDGADEPHGYE